MSYKSILLSVVAAASLGATQPKADAWSPEELAVLRSLSIDSLPPPAPDPSNRVADLAAAAELGRLLFNDTRLSANGKVACASCHDPAHEFTDRTPTGRGIGKGVRRTMPIVPAVYSTWQFWDGRADSLWAQALGPIENPVEHGFTRTQVASVISSNYASRYEAVFGSLPDFRHVRASPFGNEEARRAWAAMAAKERSAVDLVFANTGKAIAAFERRQRVLPTRFDAYVKSLFSPGAERLALSASEVRGLRIFISTGRCTTCHSGPLLTNHEFANTGVPAGSALSPDRGRIDGVRKATADPFNCRGTFNDAADQVCDELDFVSSESEEQIGALKVPSLRGVSLRPPYMHAGQFRNLDEVVEHYNRAPVALIGHSQLKPLGLTAAQKSDLVAFLKTLNPLRALP